MRVEWSCVDNGTRPGSFGVYRACGIEISAASPAYAANRIVDAYTNGISLQVHLCNAYTLSLVDSDSQLRAALASADLNLPDGVPVAWLGRRYGVKGPVRGPGLVKEVASVGRSGSVTHYLYGGGPSVADAVASRLREVAPGVLIVGIEMPPFHDLTDNEVSALAQRIEASGAQLVWVGLGTPRQDYLVPRLAAATGLVVVPVGAAFDFLSRRVSEAPPWLHGTSLEWVYRFAREPRRLWRRYLIGNPRFVVANIRHAYGRESR